MKKQLPSNQHPAGFTLLELLLVIVILSAVSFMMLSTVSNDVSQVRYEDTRNRLDHIRTAVLGPKTGSTLWEKAMLSGYVVDNGVLPANIRELVENPDYAGDNPATPDYDNFEARSPIFDPTPDGNGHNNGVDEIPLNDDQLMKGHRGAYLIGAINSKYRDGWGTRGSADGTGAMDCPTAPNEIATDEGNNEDDDNHGWCVTLVDESSSNFPESFWVDSFGMDGQANALTGDAYEEDMPMSPAILSNDWKVELTGSVTIRNLSGIDIDLSGSGDNYRVVLLVYNNDTDDVNPYNWLQLTSELSASNACLDGDGDDTCNGSSSTNEISIFFPSSITVPIGEHLLVLADDPDRDTDTSDMTLHGSSPNYVTARVKFYSRGGVPEMVLEIR
jgi:prepilin-type N-terminal cleavage/methylation domain-containing protein